MTKFAIVGIVCFLAASVLIGFQQIGGVTGQADRWDRLSLADVLQPQLLEWIDGITFPPLHHTLDLLILSPLYIVLYAGSAVFVVMHYMFKRH